MDGELENDVLSFEECALFIKKSKHTLKKYVIDRNIPHYKKLGSVYFLKSEILSWIKDGKRE